MEDLRLSDDEFEAIRTRVYGLAGISLSDAKRTMVVARLHRLVRTAGLSSFAAYIRHIDEMGGSAQQDFINALTTNLTRFWREEHHFDHMLEEVGAMIARPPRHSLDRRPRLRIWSAGCSTGQEPYSIALDLLARFPELKRWDLKVLATDVDTAVLARATRGVYPVSELAGLSPQRAALLESDGDTMVRASAAARAVVTFKPLNLIGPWPMRGTFDFVFCRNVTIYFDRETQAKVMARLADLVAPGGYLYLGHSETVASGGTFRLVGKTVYQSMRAAADNRSAA